MLAWIDSHKPEAELVIRLAMRECFPRVRGDRAWTARVDTLMHEIASSVDLMAHFLREARNAAQIIRDAQPKRR